jgi:hypothetical protein
MLDLVYCTNNVLFLGKGEAWTVGEVASIWAMFTFKLLEHQRVHIE